MRISRFPMWAVLVIGYLTFGREFAYLGVPPLYIGEAYLGFKVLQNTGNWLSRFANDCLRGRLLPLAIGLHLVWGVIEVGRSWNMGRPLFEALRTAAFNYYPLYVLIGIVIGQTVSLPRFIRFMKVLTVVYAARIVLQLFMPVFGEQINIALLPVMLIALWSKLEDWKWRYPLLLISGYPLFFGGTHGRGSMLGFVAGLVAVSLASWSRFLQWSTIGISLATLMMFIGPLIPGPQGGGPPLDPLVQISRVIASDHPNLAMKIIKWRLGGKTTGGYEDELHNLQGARGTAAWRQGIWQNAMKSLNTNTLLAMGQGEATSLADVTPDGQDIHTPHNISIYCIYYTGWIGLLIFFLFLFGLWSTGQHFRSRELNGLFAGIFWCSLMIAITGNFLETPFGAIPTYLLFGLVIGMDRRVVAIAKRSRWLAANASPDDAFSPVAAEGALVGL